MPGGPTAVVKSLIGAEVLGLRSRGAGAVAAEAMLVSREGGKCESECVVNKRGRGQFSSALVVSTLNHGQASAVSRTRRVRVQAG